MKRILVTLIAVLGAAPLAAQQGIAERLRGADPDVVRVVEASVADARTRGLPTEPLVQKAVEGTAKSAPKALVITAVRSLLDRLASASAALRDGAIDAPPAAAIEAGAFGLSAGLRSDHVAALARAGARVDGMQVSLEVAGTLAASGVPPAQVVELVSQALSSGEPPSRLLSLPAQVQSAVARGATPAAAAKGLAQAAEARARRADAPRRGGSRRPTHP